jgi:hypothetical protein
MRLRARVDQLDRRIWILSRERWKDACAEIAQTMAKDHRALVEGWHTPMIRADFVRYPWDPWARRRERLNPPRLVHALYEILEWGVRFGTPLALPPEVAQIYVDDPDAYARDDCEDCGYLAPLRARVTRVQNLIVIHRYFPSCPLCGGRTGAYRYAGPSPESTAAADSADESSKR